MDKKLSLFENFAVYAENKCREYSLTLCASLIFGFLAHMYAFTNKLVNADETSALFGKGATVTSGRWGLEITSWFLPDYSMPWIFGLVSVLLLAVSVCMIVSIFEIRSPLLCLGLSGTIMAFPALVGNFSFMFTSASYAMAIIAAVASVWLFERGGKWRAVLAVLLLAFSLGVYQAYISVASSFFVLLLFKRLMDADSRAKDVLIRGIKYVAMLLVSLVVYYAVTFTVESIAGSGYQEYEVMAQTGLVRSLLLAYSSFVRTAVSGYFGYVNSTLSMLAHLLCALVIVVGLGSLILPQRDKGKTLLTIALVIIYPLSVNCIYLIASVDIIHSLVLFGFISVYVFTAMVADRVSGDPLLLRDAAVLALSVILAGSIFYANKIYLKMYLQYENAYAFYNTLMAEVMDTPGFNSDTVVDFVGSDAGGIKVFDEIDSSMLTGPNEELVNIYTRVDFIRYYLGLDLYSYMEDEIYADWFYEMPSYPDEGSIVMREQENRIIVKFS